ncbi:PQQ-binding-like beta-propeller repeat protein, partial [Candidatus Gracilibacteria bacterium]|nr:PQQ-binding-like beta-propeller repeat protein [Candidatus Gracilibacteria bacterium]
VADLAGTLHALDAQGQPRWAVELGHTPMGTPAIGPDGTIYVVDRAAGLSAVAPDGTLRWRFQSSYRADGTSGPIVATDGTIYYTLIDGVQAVTATGESRWANGDRELNYLEIVPRLSADGSLVFLKNVAFSTTDGSLLGLDLVPDDAEFNDPTYFVGANGRNYYRSSHSALPWRIVEGGVATPGAITWEAQGNVVFFPSDSGATVEQTVWLLYSSDFADTRLVWIDNDGTLKNNLFFPLQETRAVAANADGTLTICGTRGPVRCAAYSPESAEPRWELQLEAGQIAGSALSAGRLYIALADGTLYAIE